MSAVIASMLDVNPLAVAPLSVVLAGMPVTASAVDPKATPLTGTVTVPPECKALDKLLRLFTCCPNVAAGTRRLETRRKIFVFGKRVCSAGRRGKRDGEPWDFFERIIVSFHHGIYRIARIRHPPARDALEQTGPGAGDALQGRRRREEDGKLAGESVAGKNTKTGEILHKHPPTAPSRPMIWLFPKRLTLFSPAFLG
jgi:hypothetical protein